MVYTTASIYPSSFTTVRIWTKIEFLNVVKCSWGSGAAVSSATSSWRSPVSASGGVKPLKNFGLFTSGGQIYSLK